MTLNFTVRDKTLALPAQKGDLVYDLIRLPSAGSMHTPCGGNGTCGKCRVRVSGEVSPPTPSESRFLSEEDRRKGIRLACHCRVEGDCAVSLLSSSQMDVQTEGLGGEALCDTVKVDRIALDAPTLANPIPLDRNLREALRMPDLRISGNTLNKVAALGASQLWAATSGGALVSVSAGEQPATCYALAVDVGTSTLAAYLCSLTADGGKIIDVAACENPQRAFGADVISRINFIMEHPHGLEQLARTIRGAVGELLAKLCARSGVASGEVCQAVITGNTVMQHIYAGYDPRGIANAPFVAASLFDFTLPPAEVELDMNPDGEVYLPFCFASYVGGDIATGIIASNTDGVDETRLFIDVGTNGEIALRRNGKLYLCATAAGPAFEGAHIKKGVPGIEGAINRVWVQDDVLQTETIGGGAAVGICGSGIIDAVAAMLGKGIIDETGYLESDDEVDGESVCYLDQSAEIFITQKDIREIQLAKSAVCAGILTLLEHTSTPMEEVSSLILAGGFGAHMNPASACKIGLIPPELEDRIVVGGNTAGMGAVACAMSKQARSRIAALSATSEYLELSGNATFMDLYVEHMMFCH